MKREINTHNGLFIFNDFLDGVRGQRMGYTRSKDTPFIATGDIAYHFLKGTPWTYCY